MTFEESVGRLGIRLLRDEPLAKHTTFRIGGPAEWYAAASAFEQIEALAELALEYDLPLMVLGGGSNLLVSDRGVRGLVVANQARWYGAAPAFRERWDHPALLDDQVVAESGVLLAGLARWTVRQGLEGLEWAVSVPGTVAGAVIGNAGAHGSDTAAKLAWAAIRYAGGARQVLGRDELRYAYRTSLLKAQLLDAPRERQPVVLAAGFDLHRGEAAELERRANEYLAKRRATQPVEPSAGSIFRNPPGDRAGRLIESLGLKGRQVGGAQVSPRHANFIVNVDHASAGDVAALINLLRARVYQATGIMLTPEILFVGEWPEAPLFEL